MQQRKEPNDSLDDFPTPPWATRALCKYILNEYDLKNQSVWEPACNRGYMGRPLMENFNEFWFSDIHDYGWDYQNEIFDFCNLIDKSPVKKDWVITNPPFRLAQEFILRAIDVSNVGVAVIVRTSFLEGKGRFEKLFSINPPTIIAQFVERVPMVKGRYDPKASTATSYVWLVWEKDKNITDFKWVPPCRKSLEISEDIISQNELTFGF